MTAPRHREDEIVIGAEFVAQSLDQEVQTLFVALAASAPKQRAGDTPWQCSAATLSQEIDERHFVRRELHGAVANPKLSADGSQREERAFTRCGFAKAARPARRAPPIVSGPSLELHGPYVGWAR